MITWGIDASGGDPFADLIRSAEKAARTAAEQTARDAVDQMIATAERETNIRPGLLDASVTVVGEVVRATDTPLSLAAFNPVKQGNAVVANARIGRGPERYQGAFISRSGQPYLRAGGSLVPLYGPSAARLLEDAADLITDEIKVAMIQAFEVTYARQ